MKVVTRDNVIVAISNNAEIVSNGVKLDHYILGVAVGEDGNFCEELPTIYTVETIPNGVVEQKYCYDGTNFTLNPNYNTADSVADTVADLQQQNSQIIFALVQGGLM